MRNEGIEAEDKIKLLIVTKMKYEKLLQKLRELGETEHGDLSLDNIVYKITGHKVEPLFIDFGPTEKGPSSKDELSKVDDDMKEYIVTYSIYPFIEADKDDNEDEIFAKAEKEFDRLYNKINSKKEEWLQNFTFTQGEKYSDSVERDRIKEQEINKKEILNKEAQDYLSDSYKSGEPRNKGHSKEKVKTKKIHLLKQSTSLSENKTGINRKRTHDEFKKTSEIAKNTNRHKINNKYLNPKKKVSKGLKESENLKRNKKLGNLVQGASRELLSLIDLGEEVEEKLLEQESD